MTHRDEQAGRPAPTADEADRIRRREPTRAALERQGRPPLGYRYFVTQPALSELLRLAMHGEPGVSGRLGGYLYECEETGTPRVVVSTVGPHRALRRRFGTADLELLSEPRLCSSEQSAGSPVIVGWYGIRSTAPRVLTGDDAVYHAAEWCAPWHVALILAAGSRPPEGGLYVADPTFGALRCVPFDEIPDARPRRAALADARGSAANAGAETVASALRFDNVELDEWERSMAITATGVRRAEDVDSRRVVSVHAEGGPSRLRPTPPCVVLVDSPPAVSSAAADEPALLERAARSLRTARSKLAALLADARSAR